MEERPFIKRPDSNKLKSSSFKTILQAYGAALFVSLVVIPIIASIATLGLYFYSPLSTPGWYPIVFGALFTLIVWCIIAVFTSYFTTFPGANARSYGLLTNRLRQLEARLDMLEARLDMMDSHAHLADYQYFALREARVNLDDLNSFLSRHPAGLQWFLGIGYVNAWVKLHSAEEALIEVEPREVVIRGALHDKSSLQDSQIVNRDTLLAQLTQAVHDLNPAAEVYFKEHLPVKGGEISSSRLQSHTSTDFGDAATLPVESGTSPADVAARARVVMREVRHTLNNFQISMWEGLLHARNNFLAIAALTGLLTQVLLYIVLIAGISQKNRDAILAATVFYMIGAIAGLFGRVYSESARSTAIDEYGLALPRLIVTPLLSGLAGIAGVLIVGLLYNTLLGGLTTDSQTITLYNIFTLNNSIYLLISAIFGLTPNLLISSLQQKAEQATQRTQPPSTFVEQLTQIYEHDLSQVRQWARTAAITAFLGLLLISGGVIEALIGQLIIGLILSVAGAISECIAAYSLWQVRKTNRLVDNTSRKLRESEITGQVPAP